MCSPKTLSQSKLKVTIDEDNCLGEGACLEDAPSTFRMNMCGIAEVLEDSADTADQVELAAQNCPGDAIKVEQA